MKFALFEFCEDSSCAVGESNWIVDQDEISTFNNEDWLPAKEVLVNWPVSKEYSKWTNKNGKSALESTCETKVYVVRVLKFNDQYDIIRKLMTRYLSTGTTQTPIRGRGKRESKKNGRYVNDTDDGETPVMPPAKKCKTKRKAKSNSSMSENHILILKEKLAKEKYSEDCSIESSDNSGEDDCGEDELDVDIKEMTKQLSAKDREIKALKNEVEKMKDMQNLQDIVWELKNSVREVKKLSSTPCQCKEKKITVARPEKENVQQKRPSSPVVHAIKSEASASSSSDSDIDSITLCTGIEVSRGQQKVLKCKHSAKEFVYALLPMVWTREVLCTHSVSGRQSNAHKGREAKPQLDTEKVDSICDYVAQKFGSTPKEVRNFLAMKINNVIKCSININK